MFRTRRHQPPQRPQPFWSGVGAVTAMDPAAMRCAGCDVLWVGAALCFACGEPGSAV